MIKTQYSSQREVPLIARGFNQILLLGAQALPDGHSSYDSVINQLYDAVTGDSFVNFFKNLFNKPLDALVSMRVYPIKPSKISQEALSGRAVIGKTEYDLTNNPITNKIVTRLLGTFTYKPKSFIDLAPYTTIQLSIPYMDFIEIPVNEIINKVVYVREAIDFSSGIATVYVEVDQSSRWDFDTYIIASKSAPIGLDIPFGASNAQDIKRNIINTIISTQVSVGLIAATGGAGAGTGATSNAIKGVSVAKTVSGNLLSVANSLQVSVHRGGSSTAQASLTGSMVPYLIISKQKVLPVDEEAYAHMYGKPLYQSRVLSTLKGFTVVDDIHLENFPTATSGELDEIERLLKEGVHL